MKSKKPKQEKISTIKNRLKKLVSTVVRTRDNGVCQKGNLPCCLKTNKRGKVILHCSHIFPVGLFPWMQFVSDNVKLLCYWHHFRWWHVSIVDAAKWISSYLSKDRYNKLIAMSLDKVDMGRDSLYIMEANLLEEVEKLKTNKQQ